MAKDPLDTPMDRVDWLLGELQAQSEHIAGLEGRDTPEARRHTEQALEHLRQALFLLEEAYA